MPSDETILPETTALIAIRVFLFLGCRQYLLRSLYSDLQTLSAGPVTDVDITVGARSYPSTPATNGTATHGRIDEEDIELEDLPAPVTHSNALRPKESYATSAALHSSIARTVFSLLFVESCMMFFVLMLQGVGRFTPRVRLGSWKFSLMALMSIIFLVVPLSISFLLAAAGNKSTPGTQKNLRRRLVSRLALSLLLVGVYLFLVSKIPLPPALIASDTFTAALARLVVLGTIILGVLSGYGAVSNAWGYLPFLSKSGNMPTDHEISMAEYSLQSVRNDLRERREAAGRRAGNPAATTWISRVMPSFRGSDGNLQELRGLEALEYQMTRNLESLRMRRDAAKYARTFRGRMMGIAGRVLAVYCVVRIGSSMYNLIFPAQYATAPSSDDTTTTGGRTADLIADLVARALRAVFVHSKVDVKLETKDVVSFARQLSLAMVGLIILTSVRRVLSSVTRALRITSKNMGASFMMLFLAQLMGIYLLSTIVQLRNSFPPPPLGLELDPILNAKAPNYNLFTTIPEFQVFGSLFDWSFLIAAGASAGIRWGRERVT